MIDTNIPQRVHKISRDAGTVCSQNINALPNELLARIFWYLHPIKDTLPVLAFVCRKWRALLLNNGSLWRVIHVDPRGYVYWHFSMLCCIFRLFGQHIQKLTWTDHSPVYERVFSFIPRLGNLKYLRLPILWTKSVVETLSSLTRLENIQINGGFALTDDELEMIGKCFPNLLEISLNACWRLTANGIENLVDSLTCLQTLKLKINSGLRLSDPRSGQAIQRGYDITKCVINDVRFTLVRVLCLHFVPIEMEELWDLVKRLKRLTKLSISNCEHLHGVRLVSSSLQKCYLFNLWNVLFVCVRSPTLKLLTIDHGMDTMEHVELDSDSLRRVTIDGCNVMRTLRVTSRRLTFMELSKCENIDMRSFHETLRNNTSLLSLRLGCISQDSLTFDEMMIPNLQELCLLGDFSCETLHIRSPTLRLLHTESENDIITLNHMYITANHLCKIALTGMPALKTLTIQCVSVDFIEMNLCSDDRLNLESCVIHALNAIGFLRLFDCKVNLLSVCSPLVRTIVLYRCQMTDYVLQMALNGCLNIAYLNLEKCREISKVSVHSPLMKFLNLFGCVDIHRLDLEYCPQLMALNVGQCTNLRLFIRGIEQKLSSLCRTYDIVPPQETVRWSHDFPPKPYICEIPNSHIQ
ncbi:uncharacterized protein LOC132550540 [Ylistrum balloti]|uniref:uncharacterized protein LOC132550540 n=1 Tax=Ylistrum balloti TaxID=509963 RepID=UPI002905D876|nr:uncharacterized protein LOC132550540 [Ylistrum balloti]